MDFSFKKEDETLIFKEWSSFCAFLKQQHKSCLLSDIKVAFYITIGNETYLSVGVGYDEGGFICYESHGEPYVSYISRNRNVNNDNVLVFYLEGVHYTEIDENNIISFERILKLLELFSNNQIPDFKNDEEWELS